MASGRFNGIKAKLERLYDAKSSDDVAEILRKAGAKGFRGDPTCCPIANYLNKSLRVTYYEARSQELVRFRKRRLWTEQERRVPTTDPTKDFIREFDKGKWQEFEAESEET